MPVAVIDTCETRSAARQVRDSFVSTVTPYLGETEISGGSRKDGLEADMKQLVSSQDDQVYVVDEDEIESKKAIFRQFYGSPDAQAGLLRNAKALFAKAILVRDTGDFEGAILLLVRSLELHPHSGEVKDELERLLKHFPSRDLTTECLIFPDMARATQFYGDAIQRALDFVTYNGVIGDVLEFGVLGGWTARLFAERMRNMQFYGDLHLFDSFAGLPREKLEIDRQSYDVNRGIWEDEMDLPETWKAEISVPLPVHIKAMLSRVISGDRIHIREGFYSDTLVEPLRTKASIVHLDCDLYQSTREVLQALHRDDALQDGTILLFDDWNCNRGNPAFGQRRAFREFLDQFAERYAVSPFFNYGFNCAAFILHDLHGVPLDQREDASRYFVEGSTRRVVGTGSGKPAEGGDAPPRAVRADEAGVDMSSAKAPGQST